MKFRTGSKLDERTLYLQLGDHPDHRPPSQGGDLLIGLVDPGWGRLLVTLLNAAAEAEGGAMRYPAPGPEALASITAAHARRADPNHGW